MKAIDVVIPVADKNDKITRTCLEHLEKTQRYPFNPILIEDRGESFRFGKSMNRGISQAESDLVIAMDSDALPEKGAIGKILKFAEKYPDVGYFGVRLTTKNRLSSWSSLGWVYKNALLSCFKNSITSIAPIYFFKRVFIYGIIWDIVPIDKFVPGMVGQATSFFAIRKDCWNDINGFDEQFRTSYSDVDLCFRILLSDKWKITTCPDVEAFHLGHMTRSREYKEAFDKAGDRKKYDAKWPHERILEVVKASKNGKFVIPIERQ